MPVTSGASGTSPRVIFEPSCGGKLPALTDDGRTAVMRQLRALERSTNGNHRVRLSAVTSIAPHASHNGSKGSTSASGSAHNAMVLCHLRFLTECSCNPKQGHAQNKDFVKCLWVMVSMLVKGGITQRRASTCRLLSGRRSWLSVRPFLPGGPPFHRRAAPRPRPPAQQRPPGT